jgi:glycosyltransferase involved in cell wall biosynthesis
MSGIWPPDIGGPATFNPELVRFLVEQGWEVNVVSRTNNKSSKEDFTGAQVHLISRKTNRYLRTLLSFVTSLKLARKSDLVFDTGLTIEAALVAKLSRKPLVIRLVGDLVWERHRNRSDKPMVLGGSPPSISLKVLRQILSRAVKSSSLVISPSNELLEIAKLWANGIEICFIPNGVKIPEVYIRNNQKLKVLICSRLVPWKNIDKVLKSLSAVDKQSFELKVVGSGPDRKKLELLANQFDYRFEFLGDLENPDLHELMLKSDIFIQYSEYEGMSFSVLEAMAAGMTVVAGKCQGNELVIKENINGLLVDTNSEKSLIDAVIVLISDADKRSRLARAARETIRQDFDLTHTLNQYSDLLKKFAHV